MDCLDGRDASTGSPTRISIDNFRRLVRVKLVSRVVHAVVRLLELAEGVAGQRARVLDPTPNRVLFPTRWLLHAHPADHRRHVHILLVVDRGGL